MNRPLNDVATLSEYLMYFFLCVLHMLFISAFMKHNHKHSMDIHLMADNFGLEYALNGYSYVQYAFEELEWVTGRLQMIFLLYLFLLLAIYF